MAKRFLVLTALSVLLLLPACAGGGAVAGTDGIGAPESATEALSERVTGGEDSDRAAVMGKEMAFPAPSETAVCEGDGWTMRVDIPEGWSWEVVPADSGLIPPDRIPDDGRGLAIFPEDRPETFVLFLRYPYLFGVCGTGLETADLTLTDGVKARVGRYHGNSDWSFVSFHGYSENVAADNFGLTGADAETALEILRTARYGTTEAA